MKNGYNWYIVEMSIGGSVRKIEKGYNRYMRNTIVWTGVIRYCCLAKNEEHAIEMTNEKRLKHLTS